MQRVSHKAKVVTSLQRLTNRTLFAAFATWREWASHKGELKKKLQGAVGKLWHGQLSAAWQAWRHYVHYSVDVKARLQVHNVCLMSVMHSKCLYCLLRGGTMSTEVSMSRHAYR